MIQLRLRRASFDIQYIASAIFIIFLLGLFFPLSWRVSSVSMQLCLGAIGLVLIMKHVNISYVLKNFDVNIFFIVYLLYSVLSLIWADSFSLAILQIKHIYVHFCTFYITFFILTQSQRIREYYPLMMVFIIIVYLIACFWEVITWRHLPVSRHADILYPSPTGFFYGENIQAMILSLMLPFLGYYYSISRKSLHKFFFWLLMLASITVITIEGARIAMLVIGPLFLYVMLRHSNFKFFLLSLLILSVLLFQLMHKYPKQYVIGQEYVRDQITSISKETKTYKIGSTRIRINMGKRAVKYFFDSKMMGVGAGNFDEKSQKGYFGDIDWIQNPHSYIFELLSNYGIIVIIPFGIFIVTLGLRLLKIVSKTTGRLRTLALFNFISIIVFLIVSNLPSSMFNIYVIWIHLGYLASFVKCNT